MYSQLRGVFLSSTIFIVKSDGSITLSMNLDDIFNANNHNARSRVGNVDFNDALEMKETIKSDSLNIDAGHFNGNRTLGFRIIAEPTVSSSDPTNHGMAVYHSAQNGDDGGGVPVREETTPNRLNISNSLSHDFYIESLKHVAAFAQPYLHALPDGSLDPDAVNFDRLGILYEYFEFYFTICEVTEPKTGEVKLIHAWMPRHNLGPYIKREWASLPKVKVGAYGAGVASSEGWWKVHGMEMQNLRSACLAKVQDLEIAEYNWTGKKISFDGRRYAIQLMLTQLVDKYCGDQMAAARREAKEADALLREFTNASS